MDIGNRMKNNYENRYRFSLTRRIPVIIRIDGKSFHSFTKGFRRPFDELLYRTMVRTGLEVCKNIQGSKIAYIQSDEISILLTDYDKLTTSAYFDYNLNKINSVTSSMATLYFNKIFREEVEIFSQQIVEEELKLRDSEPTIEQYEYYQQEYINELRELLEVYKLRIDSALFDCRSFNIPESEVVNYFIWRQLDATRNSIEMLGQKYYSANQLKGVSCNQIQEMLFKDYKINWNNNPVYIKRGSTVIRDESGNWIIDEEIPIFTSDRNYIERFLPIADKE